MIGVVEGMQALDLFAGSGALGIEAISRGAQKAVFVERDAATLRVLRGSLADLGIAAEQADVRPEDALAALRTARKRRETYDLVFVDPPYRDALDWAEELRTGLPPVLGAEARVIVESDRRLPLELALELERERRYGDTLITIHRNR